MQKSNIIAWAKNNAVMLIAAAAALVTACLVPPDGRYLAYFDWRTLSCLFCILGLVAAFRHAGFFERCSELALRGFKTSRQMILALTLMTGIASMFITNDMALILFLPLSTIILLTSGHTKLIPLCFIMQTLAANLMGMIMPFGNPQNLFLFSFFEISLFDFLQTMCVPFAVSVVGIILCCVIFTREDSFSPKRASMAKSQKRSQRIELTADVAAASDTRPSSSPAKSEKAEEHEEPSSLLNLSNEVRWIIYGLLFLVTLTGVFRLLPFWLPLGIVAIALLVLDRKAVAKVDWGLLLTFVFFFIFSGNMARIPEVHVLMSGLMSANALVCSALLSQVISNVPSAVLLAQFTGNWPALLIGVNVGGAGTVVGSLASLITLNHFRKVAISRPKLTMGSYMAKFSAFNFAFLIGLLVICALAGY